MMAARALAMVVPAEVAEKGTGAEEPGVARTVVAEGAVARQSAVQAGAPVAAAEVAGARESAAARGAALAMAVRVAREEKEVPLQAALVCVVRFASRNEPVEAAASA